MEMDSVKLILNDQLEELIDGLKKIQSQRDYLLSNTNFADDSIQHRSQKAMITSNKARIKGFIRDIGIINALIDIMDYAEFELEDRNLIELENIKGKLFLKKNIDHNKFAKILLNHSRIDFDIVNY